MLLSFGRDGVAESEREGDVKRGELVVKSALDKLLLETLSIVACETCVVLKTLVTIVLKHGVSEISDGI